MAKKGKLGRGSRVNSHKSQHIAYRAEGRRKKNKVAKLKTHLVRFPNDAQAKTSLASIERNGQGVKARRAWRIKYKPNKLSTKSAMFPPMMYREAIAPRGS